MTGRRPRLLDVQTADRILDALRVGNGRTSAARLAGVSPSALFDWLRRGREGESPFLEFSERLKRAEAEFENAALTRIQEAAASGTWTAAAWLLERRNPRRWARRDALVEGERARSEAWRRASLDEKRELVARAATKLDGFRADLAREEERRRTG